MIWSLSHNAGVMAEPAYRPVPLAFERLAVDEQRVRLGAFRRQMLTRRTVRHYLLEPRLF